MGNTILYNRFRVLYPGGMFNRQWLYFGVLFSGLLVADQATKSWAEHTLDPEKTLDFGFALSHNDGIVWGLDLPLWLIFVLTGAVFILGAYLVYENRLWRDKWHLTGLALILAGAVGNLMDRIRLGHVIDFIKVYWWPTFNIADACIVAALFVFAYEFLVRDPWDKGV